MAGWNQYIDNILAQSSEQCDKACIIGLDGSQWTTADHPNCLKLTPAEVATITRVLGEEVYTFVFRFFCSLCTV